LIALVFFSRSESLLRVGSDNAFDLSSTHTSVGIQKAEFYCAVNDAANKVMVQFANPAISTVYRYANLVKVAESKATVFGLASDLVSTDPLAYDTLSPGNVLELESDDDEDENNTLDNVTYTTTDTVPRPGPKNERQPPPKPVKEAKGNKKDWENYVPGDNDTSGAAVRRRAQLARQVDIPVVALSIVPTPEAPKVTRSPDEHALIMKKLADEAERARDNEMIAIDGFAGLFEPEGDADSDSDSQS